MLARMFQNMDRLRTNYIKQLNLMSELQHGLTQDWIKMSEIQFTSDTLLDLLDAYHAAIEEGRDVFTFQGHHLWISYAKYLIEYLEGQFPETRVPVLTKRRAHQARMQKKGTRVEVSASAFNVACDVVINDLLAKTSNYNVAPGECPLCGNPETCNECK